jgi:hypothetical protein
MSALAPFINRHFGATAFLFGKGPSLDAFLESRHDIRLPFGSPVVLAFLNDTLKYRAEIIAAVRRIAGSDCVVHAYAFATDSIAPWVSLYLPGDCLFQPARTTNDPSMQAPDPNCLRIVYQDSGGDHWRLERPRDWLGNHTLVSGHGTCDAAAQIIHIMGCSNLVAVGMDGSPGRATREWLTAMRDDHAKDYAEIRRDFERITLRIGLRVEFYGEPKIHEPSGEYALRTTAATIYRGSTIEADCDIANASAEDAANLIGCGRAERVPTAA